MSISTLKDQRIDLLVNNTKSIDTTRIYLKKIGCNISNIKFHKLKTDRLWLRDSGPIFLVNNKIDFILSEKFAYKAGEELMINIAYLEKSRASTICFFFAKYKASWPNPQPGTKILDFFAAAAAQLRLGGGFGGRLRRRPQKFLD